VVVGSLSVLCLSLVLGCDQSDSKPTAHLSGTVTINGRPLPANVTGTIMFRPSGKGMAKTAGVSLIGGKYDSPETPVGEVTVFFSIQEPTGNMISDAGGPPFPELRSIVPQESTNGVKLQVTGENPQQDFDLK
jgi:hypothetical protein